MGERPAAHPRSPAPRRSPESEPTRKRQHPVTNPEVTLNVVTDHIRQLADAQSRAADQFTGANRAVAGASDRVRETHGLICALTSAALTTADETRVSLGEGFFTRSMELSAKLTA